MVNVTPARGLLETLAFNDDMGDQVKDTELRAAWDAAVSKLDPDELGPLLMSFIEMTQPLGDIEGTILVAVPNEFTKRFIESRTSDTLTAALAETTGRPARLAITIDPSLETTSSEGDLGEESTTANSSTTMSSTTSSDRDRDHTAGTDGSTAGESSHSGIHEDTHTSPQSALATPSSPMAHGTIAVDDSRLNHRFTFDTFVVGKSNRFPHSAAAAVAEGPGKTYNPLFIYGDSGLGKTHLLHAIGNYVLNLYPSLKVKYVSSEEFTNDFINSIRDDCPTDFQRRYREIDVLLIDDIQFIQGKEQTVEEFFHTFNTLYNLGKQVVITSDVPPKQLQGLEDRMRSRFEMGLLADIQPPDLETRNAILRKKAAADNLNVDDDVLEYIASRIKLNIRELEGSLIRITAYSNLTRQKITRSLAELVLKDIVSNADDTEITPALIMGQTADYFAVTVEQLCSADRSRDLVEARQIAMYLCRELTDLSLPKIGQTFGGRDHTTVMHAQRKISQQMTHKHDVFTHVTELTNRIKQQARNSHS